MDKMNTNVLLKIIETGSFARAARELSYTQAGISYIVASIEQELGFSIFAREHGGVSLTREGELLLPLILDIEKDQRMLEHAISDINDCKSGHIRVLVFNSISIKWIPGILTKFKKDYPGISVDLITIEDSKRAEEMVLKQDADCAFFLHCPVSKKIESRILLTEKLKAVVPPKHPSVKKKIFTAEDIVNTPYINMMYSDVTGIDNVFKQYGVTPQTVYTMDNDYAALAMTNAGHGFCIFSELLLKNCPYKVGIVDFDKELTRTISIGTKSFSEASAATAKFIEYTCNWVKENA